jgi:hypothetical protein
VVSVRVVFFNVAHELHIAGAEVSHNCGIDVRLKSRYNDDTSAYVAKMGIAEWRDALLRELVSATMSQS